MIRINKNESPLKPLSNEQLATIIKNYMNVNLTPNQEENIAHIKAGANVVIGGQQAGLFVSPMYTIHKIISIITLAKEQSKALGEPVVPVFWIAGEDHDFEEVNHAFIYNKNEHKMNKVNFKSYQVVTNGVSNVTMTDKEKETTIILVIHDINLGVRYSDEIIMLNKTKILSTGKPESVITKENIELAYNIEVAIDKNKYTDSLYLTPLKVI